MAVLARGVLATILLLGATTPTVAQEYLPDDPPVDAWQATDDADAAPPITPADYENALAPYGQWADDPTYGQVWRPEVAYGWRPYVDGYWAWTPYGWTWVSSEPWAWTLHYGRWGFVPALGWVWVPGSVWGPAWVDWFWGDGFVGWAPLPPFGALVVIDQFVFVHAADFCHPHLATVVVDHRLVPDPVIHDWMRHDFHPPPRREIEGATHGQVVRFERKPPNSFLPMGTRLARPTLHPQPPTALGVAPPAVTGRLEPRFSPPPVQLGPARPIVQPSLGATRAPAAVPPGGRSVRFTPLPIRAPRPDGRHPDGGRPERSPRDTGRQVGIR
jgi:uncharacterized protein DUF6600